MDAVYCKLQVLVAVLQHCDRVSDVSICDCCVLLNKHALFFSERLEVISVLLEIAKHPVDRHSELKLSRMWYLKLVGA